MKKLLLGMAAAALLGGCGAPFNEAQFNKEFPCRAVPAEPYRCKLEKEAEAYHKAAQEAQEEQTYNAK